MKPISQLKIYRSARNTEAVLENILVLTANPKRLLRGPRFSAKPSNGKFINAENVSERAAVSACPNGLIDLVARGGRRGTVAMTAREQLNQTKERLFPDLKSHATVGDQKGLRAFRKLVSTSLKDLRSNA